MKKFNHTPFIRLLSIRNLPSISLIKVKFLFKIVLIGVVFFACNKDDGPPDKVEADVMPALSGSIAAQVYTQNSDISPLDLPAATGGNGTLAYTLMPALPTGLGFDADARRISGRPTEVVATPRDYTYTATDADGDLAALNFTITVNEDLMPSFASQPAIDSQTYIIGTAIISPTFPEVSSGNTPLTYSISPALPAGLTLNTGTGVLSGTPSVPKVATTYTVTVTDIDGDEDTFAFTITVLEFTPSGLIPINTLEQLNAIRYDLDGNGQVDGGGMNDTYMAAFPRLSAANTYTGYQLTKNLDFSSDDSYSDPATNKIRYGGDQTGSGWSPIGGTFNGTFDGGGHTIDKLYINRSDLNASIGLFSKTGGSGSIRRLGITNAKVTGGTFVNEVGCLVGRHNGGGKKFDSCYVSNSIVTGGGGKVGVLVGRQDGGSIRACYVSNSTATGGTDASVGNLAGLQNFGTLLACYVANSTVTAGTGTPAVGSLVGEQNNGKILQCYAGGKDYTNIRGRDRFGFSIITHSYHQGTTSSGNSQTSGDLQAPTDYTGIYAEWDVDVSGDAMSDDPWDFGTSSQYPVLKIDFNGDGSTADDVRRQRQ
ncbi:MAG: Ig domain-containing protein [Ekhidna sp.]|nr:Ig domain-containing protein [Ekhidna sp.]